MPGRKKLAKKKTSPGAASFDLSEEMKQWCALLRQELESWGQVDVRKMFGMTSFYRRDQIFAAIPATKAFFSPNSIIFKLQEPTAAQQKKLEADARVNLKFGIGRKWYGYELASAADIRGALEWLDQAFQAARPAQTSARKRTA